MSEYRHTELTEKIIAAAYAVHNDLGSGFVEKVYKNAMLIDFGTSVEIKRKVF